MTSRTKGKWIVSPSRSNGSEKQDGDYHQGKQEDVHGPLEPHGDVILQVAAASLSWLLPVVV